MKVAANTLNLFELVEDCADHINMDKEEVVVGAVARITNGITEEEVCSALVTLRNLFMEDEKTVTSIVSACGCVDAVEELFDPERDAAEEIVEFLATCVDMLYIHERSRVCPVTRGAYIIGCLDGAARRGKTGLVRSVVLFLQIVLRRYPADIGPYVNVNDLFMLCGMVDADWSSANSETRKFVRGICPDMFRALSEILRQQIDCPFSDEKRKVLYRLVCERIEPDNDPYTIGVALECCACLIYHTSAIFARDKRPFTDLHGDFLPTSFAKKLCQSARTDNFQAQRYAFDLMWRIVNVDPGQLSLLYDCVEEAVGVALHAVFVDQYNSAEIVVNAVRFLKAIAENEDYYGYLLGGTIEKKTQTLRDLWGVTENAKFRAKLHLLLLFAIMIHMSGPDHQKLIIDTVPQLVNSIGELVDEIGTTSDVEEIEEVDRLLNALALIVEFYPDHAADLPSLIDCERVELLCAHEDCRIGSPARFLYSALQNMCDFPA